MAKVMLVEDDNQLREIYSARLLAEGYEIVSAANGEDALALAIKESPDLILADVMMPKISGFDMLDILRTTPETKDTKVIMMTALSQQEDKDRANKLGADHYLVKSQITLEDMAQTVADVLSGSVPTNFSTTGSDSTDDTASNDDATTDQEITSPSSAPSNTPQDTDDKEESDTKSDDSQAISSAINNLKEQSNTDSGSDQAPSKTGSDNIEGDTPEPIDTEKSNTTEEPKTDGTIKPVSLDIPELDMNLAKTIEEDKAEMDEELKSFVESKTQDEAESVNTNETPSAPIVKPPEAEKQKSGDQQIQQDTQPKSNVDSKQGSSKKVIQPIQDPLNEKSSLTVELEKELAKEVEQSTPAPDALPSNPIIPAPGSQDSQQAQDPQDPGGSTSTTASTGDQPTVINPTQQ